MRLLIFFIIFTGFSAFAQEISGVVKNDSPISYVNIYVSETSNGTISNSKGEFVLKVNSLKDTIVFSSLGFVTKKIIAQDIKNNHIVVLDLDNYPLDPVNVLSKSDKGKAIIKNVISNRKINDYMNNNFKADLYVKSIIARENKALILKEKELTYMSMTEKFSKVEHSNSNKWKETTIGIKDLSHKKKSKVIYNSNWVSNIRRKAINSQTKSDLFFSNVSDGEFNFYNSTILIPKLAQNPFVSPTGKLGLFSYLYSHENVFLEDGRLIHEIKVTPKRPEESVFEGTVQIEDSSWAIVSINLKMNGNKLHRYSNFRVYQRFNIQENKRVIDRQEFFYYYGQFIDIMHHGSVYCKFTNYEFPNKKIKIRNLSRLTLDSAEQKTQKFWTDKRSIKLNSKELNFIEAADSLKRLKKSLRYIKIKDSLNNKFSILEFIFEGTDHYNTPKGLRWKLDPLIKQTRFYGIGGYRHAIGGTLIKDYSNKNELFVKGTANYGFKNGDILSDAEIKYTYAPKKFAQLRIEGGSKYEMLTYMQNLATLFSRGNFLKNKFIGFGHFFEIINGVFFDAKIRYMHRSPITDIALSEWSENLFDEDNKPIDFEEYKELNMKLMLSYTPFQKFAIEQRKKVILGSNWPTFKLGWEHGIPDVFQSKINYLKTLIGIDHNFKLGLLGNSKLNTWYGRYINANSVEYPNFTFFRGTDKYFFSHPLYSFQLLGKTYTSLKSYLSINYVHHFHGVIMKKLPIFKKTKLESVIGGGILLIDDNDFNHGEIYTGIEIPFRIMETKLKFGSYYAVAYSNYSNLRNMIKFGLNIFNPFTNKWAF